MPSKETSDKSQDRPTTDGKERRKKIRVKRKSSSRHVADDDDSIDDPVRTSEVSSMRRKTSMPIPELNRRVDSPNTSQTSLPYPSFSKAHSREAVGSKESLSTPPRKNVFTPDPTDLQDKKDDEPNTERRTSTTPAVNVDAPPSPPLTASEPAFEVRPSPSKIRRAAGDRRDHIRSSSGLSARRGSPLGATRSHEATSRKSSARTVPIPDATSSIPSKPSYDRDILASTPPAPNSTAPSSIANSESTSATPKQRVHNSGVHAMVDDDSSPETGSDLSIKTPTPRGTPAPQSYKTYVDQSYPVTQPSPFYASPVPPPPPPPPPPTLQAPRVDYLMQHGGLRHVIPKRFITAPNPNLDSPWVAGELPNPTDINARVQAFFAPFRDTLNGYTKVIEKSGSIAVATGYRSIARRLLDRLEAVFARDISSEICACMMCDTPDNVTLDDERGVSWGEILEYVSGRRELPQWPPFILAHEPLGLGISREAVKTPCQTLDIDVPEEYRDHYIRQSKRTKESVDSWLANQNVNITTPPEEADDDTLTFAILTHLDPQLRPTYKELLGITSLRPGSIRPAMSPSRSQTPLSSGKTEIVEKSKLAFQRLYRLTSNPRAPEVATFLVNNQHLHNVLATLAAISDAEWEILISGRFDGFLRSGAEDAPNLSTPAAANVMMSRGFTPAPGNFPISSASAGAPVAIDEETEIAVLAEVEREIFQGMEALEDAFESLHTAAESVRRVLRERGAGLSMAAQARRGASADLLEARLGTPASMMQGGESEGDDWMDGDAFSELAPDDSASMISKNRIRRKRRDERRTPAAATPVEENSGGFYHYENDRYGKGSGGGNSGGGGGGLGNQSRNSYRRRC